MENQNSVQKTILTYGIILGIVGIVINLLNYSFGDIYYNFKSETLKADGKVINIIIGLLGFIAMILVIIYAIKAFKNANNGFLKLGEAIKIGVGVALISAIISIIYQIILSKVIEPEYYNKASEFMQQAMMERFPDMPEEQMEASLNMSKKFMSIGFIAAMALGFSLLFGLIISAIAGAIMKKEEN